MTVSRRCVARHLGWMVLKLLMQGKLVRRGCVVFAMDQNSWGKTEPDSSRRKYTTNQHLRCGSQSPLAPLYWGFFREFSRRCYMQWKSTRVNVILKGYRKSAYPVSVLSLDVKQALDSVSHSSIARAMLRMGLDSRTISYVMSSYEENTTVLQYESATSDEITV